MSGDRLAAARAQRERDGPSPYQAHEMTTLRSENTDLGSMSAFLAEIQSIQDGISQYNDNVRQISELHARSLSAVDDASQRESAQLGSLSAETRDLSNTLKRRIASLSSPAASQQEAQTRSDHATAVSERFRKAIENYQRVEQDYRAKSKQRVERQFRIVKPNATQEEIAAVVEGNEDNQVFAQALSSSIRYGESRAAYREVQERHQDIRKMEQTLGELAQLFVDMATIVEQQDFPVTTILDSSRKVEEEVRAGFKHTDDATESARRARKLRWVCFFITLGIIIVLALVLGIKFGVPAATNKSNNSGSATKTITTTSSTPTA